MNPITILKLIVRGDTAAARKALADLGTQARSVASRMNDGFERVKGSLSGLRGVLAAVGVGAFVRQIVRETSAAEHAVAQLDAVLRSTKGAAGLVRDELLKMAAARQQATTFGDDEILGAERVLLTYTQIGRETFPRALDAALDLATAMGVDLSSAAETVARAIGYPTKATEALAKQGFRFTEQQLEQIEALEKSGRMGEAQAIILEELELAYAGAASAARGTFGGALQALGNTFGDLLEGRGGGLIRAREEVEKLIDKLDDPETVAAFGALTTAVLDAAGVLLSAATKFVEVGQGLGIFLGRITTGVSNPEDQIEVLNAAIERNRNELQIARQQYESFDRFVEERAAAARERIAALEREAANLADAKRVLDESPETFLQSGTGGAPSAPPTKPEPPRTNVAIVDEEAAKAAEQRAEAIQRLIDGLREEAETTGFTAGQIALYRLEQLGASEAELERARGLVGAAEAQQLFADASKELLEIQERQRREAEQHAQTLEQFAESVKNSVDPTRVLRQELERLNEVREAGLISSDEYAAAQKRLQEEIEAAGKETTELSVFADQAARNMQSAFADFLFDPFEDGVKGMADAFVEALKRMAAEAAAAKVFEAIRGAASGEGSDGDGGFFKDLFGGIFGKSDGAGGAGGAGDGGGGGGGDFFKKIFAAVFHDGGIAGDVAVMRQIPIAMLGGLPKFHGGGDVLGLSSDEVPAILQRGERVLTVEETRALDRGGLGRSLNMTVVTPSPERFSQSASQIGAATATLLARAKNRNG